MIRLFIVSFSLFFYLLFYQSFLVSAADISFYVALNGKDTWSGKLLSPNTDSTDGPFATLEKARDAIRELKKQGPLPGIVYVNVRAGKYYPDKPFVLEFQDSGTDKTPIIYNGYSNEQAIFSGGKQITAQWKPYKGNIMMCTLPDVKEGKWYFRQLFVNGKRQIRARIPDTSYFQLAGVLDGGKNKSAFNFKSGDIQKWTNLNDIEVIVIQAWTAARLLIQSVDEGTRTVTFTGQTVYGFDDYTSLWGIRKYYVENVFEGLNSPGEWYLDRVTGNLYYYPPLDVNLTEATVIAPKLNQLLELKYTQYIGIGDLIFTETDWSLPATGYGGPSGGDIIKPSAITFGGTDHCTLVRNRITNVGTYGFEFGSACTNSTITYNEIAYTGCGGIHFSGGNTVKNNFISQNYIHHVGSIFPGSVGMWVGSANNNTVSYNHIHDISYCGIVSTGYRNIFEYNHIHHVMQRLSDGGCIYTYDVNTGGTIIRNNVLHDSYPFHHMAWGIYLDGYSQGITVRDNLVYRTLSGCTMNNGGKNNKWINNIFINSADVQAWWHFEQGKTEGVRYVGNIFYYTNPSSILIRATGTFFKQAFEEIDYNLYCCTGGSNFIFGNIPSVKSFQDWQNLGFDKHSIIADPMFVDPGNDDYTLKQDSPIFALRSKIKGIDTIETEFNLSQNYPNPFSGTTSINFELAQSGIVVLKVYNILGQEVKTLINSNLDAGFHEITWDGKNNQGSKLAAGIYIYRIHAAGFTRAKKMILF